MRSCWTGGCDRCSFVCRVEVLCHDINVHVPHHISSKIPWYNLRAATDSLRENWGQVGLPHPISHLFRWQHSLSTARLAEKLASLTHGLFLFCKRCVSVHLQFDLHC